jgi:two-component system, NtrC family, response regulator AtoC
MLADLSQSLSIDPADLPNDQVIFGSTPAMQDVRRSLDRAVRESLPVLIQGESGTGKEVIAKYLHLQSNSHGAPFIKMNCVAFTPSLLRSQLQQKNASSKAGPRQPSIEKEACSGGTLFLDEIGDMDWKLQEELIDLLSSQQDEHAREFAGCARMRIVCSTRIGAEPIGQDPRQRDGLVRLRLPALRERKQDIPQLCEFLMQKQSARFGKEAHRLTSRTLRLLGQWQWPGNLRELENWVARVVILGSQEKLAEELRDQAVLDGAPNDLSGLDDNVPDEAQQAVSAATQAAILRILEAHGWSRRRAARELRMSYRALLGRLRNANAPRRRRSHKESPPSG